MTVKQALKLKNQLAKEIQELYGLINSNNSTIKDNPKYFKVVDMMVEVDEKIAQLTELKAKIHEANSKIYKKIFFLSELKGQAQMYARINTKEGKISDRYNNGGEPTILEAELNIKQVGEIVKAIEAKINLLQEELDYHNATTEI